ncbi:hypothetical protein AVEN_56677-1 [Araneus ventricosus]|uniref:Uncharacterized protein n=1 Tax=Araneus ventricosus TaxID=182803 RepID=A0A4Y2BWY2_ARAVE|nr:hypothetical protein AVEN_56677-1 [Araneus ventricosus]
MGWPGLEPCPWRRTWRIGDKFWRSWRQIDDSRKCDPILDISIRKENTFECIRLFHVTSRHAGGDYIRATLGSERVVIDWNDFGISSAVRARKPLR